MGRLTLQFFLWLISSIAITIATGIYLWSKDDDLTCTAPNYLSDRSIKANWVVVSKRYDDVLKIFFTLAIVDVVRQFIMIVAVLKRSPGLAMIYQLLVLNDVLGFGAIFVLHAFRFDLAGKICAGDYDYDKVSYPYNGSYLLSKGAYLKGLVYWIWIGGFLLCTLSTCFALLQFRPLLHSLIGRIVGAWKSISIVSRMKQANQKDLLNY